MRGNRTNTFYLSSRHAARIRELDVGATFLQPGEDLGDLNRGALWYGTLDEVDGVKEAQGSIVESLEQLGGLPRPP